MDVVTYSLLDKKIKGLTSGIQGTSISGTTITFTMADGSKEVMTFPTPADGVSIMDVDVDANNHLIVTLSDGNTVDAGLIPTVKGDKGEQGKKGDTGFSPTITENPDNTNEIYKLDVTNEDGTFTTPNLKGTGGGLDPDKYYDKTQINTLIEPLNEAKHTHDNKDTVLDKLATNDTGDTLLFNGNAIKGSVEIDDTSTTATDKTWSANKINSSLPKVNNGKLTIQVNGKDVASFSANQASTSTANIEVPTKTSELTNDSNFVVKNTAVPNVIAIPQNGAVLLTWTAISGANKYRIQRQNGTTWNTLTMVDTTSYLNTGLTNGTVYSYRVLASTDGGTIWGSFSEIASATPLVNMINSGTGAASTTNCPVGCWYGQYS